MSKTFAGAVRPPVAAVTCNSEIVRRFVGNAILPRNATEGPLDRDKSQGGKYPKRAASHAFHSAAQPRKKPWYLEACNSEWQK